MNRPPKADTFKRTNAYFEMLKPVAQNTPNMTIYVNEACTWINGKIVEYIGGNTPAITAPASGLAKWVLVTLNQQGALIVTDGTAAANPNVLPDVPANQLPIALIFVKSTDTKISNDMIYDVRPFLDTQVIKTHNMIVTRDEVDSHPIAAITGLTAALDARPTTNQIDTLLNDKANITGTISTDFTLNSDETGAPSSNVALWVNRGAQTRVGIMWDETDERWKYTNDGTVWTSLGFDGLIENADNDTKGIVTLSVAPVSAASPIAVGDNDPRISAIANKANSADVYTKTEVDTLIDDVYTKTETDTLLGNKADSSSLTSLVSKIGTDDIEITDITKGIILKSPDGTRYRVTVANGGTLSVNTIV